MMVSRTSFCIYLGPHAEKKHFYVIKQVVFECLEPEKITCVSGEYSFRTPDSHILSSSFTDN